MSILQILRQSWLYQEQQNSDEITWLTLPIDVVFQKIKNRRKCG